MGADKSTPGGFSDGTEQARLKAAAQPGDNVQFTMAGSITEQHVYDAIMVRYQTHGNGVKTRQEVVAGPTQIVAANRNEAERKMLALNAAMVADIDIVAEAYRLRFE